MAILMLINLKGGVAKTTNAVALAECLASNGYRTLLVDADHQCMAGELLLGEDRMLQCERRRRTLHDLLARMLDDDFDPGSFPGFVAEKASDIGGGLAKLSVIPCSVRIDDFSTNMARAKRGYRSNEEFLRVFAGRRERLRRWLAAHYDFTIVDCPPSLALQVKVFLTVADGYVVPSVPDRLSVRGSLFLTDRLQSHGYKVRGLGTLWSLFRDQNALHKRIVDLGARGVAPLDRLPRPFQTVIPNAARIAAAAEPGQRPSTFNQKYTAVFAKLYKALCAEVIKQTEWSAQPTPDKPELVNT